MCVGFGGANGGHRSGVGLAAAINRVGMNFSGTPGGTWPACWIPLARLQPHQVQRFYRDLLESGRSGKTARNVHGVLHRALDQALRWRLVSTNVADLVDPPRAPRREMTALDPDQAGQALEAASGDDLEGLWRLALTAAI